ncbi:hypothetical protein DH2020_023893 [Rehmannia glutinosa]|uniref:Plant bHLH transcription factor ACT-like domain-containing protein n=1 Tax=Rehmannia glutinosa TaxID=99300 RepID=A0ABR0WBI2_REHGL
MLAMAEGVGGHDGGFLWDDDDSWAFPILPPPEKNGDGKIFMDIGNSDGRKGKEVEEAAPPPPRGEEEEHRRHHHHPPPPPVADKATIVDEAVAYIQKLQQTLEQLEKQKIERLIKGKIAITTTCDPSNITHQNKLAITHQSREAFLAEQGSTSQTPVALANPNPLFNSGPELSPIFKTWTSSNVVLSVCGKEAHINICCPKKPGPLARICFVLEKYKLEVVSAQVSSADRDRRMYMINVRANGAPGLFPGSLFVMEEIYKQAAAEIMMFTYVMKERKAGTLTKSLEKYLMKRWTKLGSLRNFFSSNSCFEEDTSSETGSVLQKLWSDFQCCVGLSQGSRERLHNLAQLISQHKQTLLNDVETNPNLVTKNSLMEQYVGSAPPLDVTVFPPSQAKNKGSGSRVKSRIQSQKEKAVKESHKLKRRCGKCGEVGTYNSRTCTKEL